MEGNLGAAEVREWEIMGLGGAGSRFRGGKGRYSRRGRRGSWVEGFSPQRDELFEIYRLSPGKKKKSPQI